LHRSHLPLRTWFLAAWLMATHKNGISARQLWRQLGIGSCKSAWLLCTKLRQAMVDPAREPLAGLVEVDETSIPFRTKNEPVTAKPGRAGEGKLLIAGAVEIKGKAPGRARLAVIDDCSARRLESFIAAALAAGSTVVSDGWSGYARLKDVKHDPKIIGPMAAMWCCLGRTGYSPTPSAGPWASITACARSTCKAISTSSCSGSIAATHPPPPLPASSNSAPLTSPLPTRC
jgi:ISXO2-like transposase domain